MAKWNEALRIADSLGAQERFATDIFQRA
jgi:hypothetical protein